MLGALLALASAATFGFNSATIRRGVLTASVLQAMAITVPLGVPLFALACLPFEGFQAVAEFSLPAWLWMSLAGVVHFVIGRYGNYRSTHALGANLSSPIQQLSVPISIVLAIIYLDETLTPVKVIGLLLVMLGPTVMMRETQGGRSQRTRSGFEPRYREGFFWGINSALAYGASPLFIMKGLGPDGGLVESIAGGFISYTTAAIVVIALVIVLGGINGMGSMDPTGGKWFFVSGVFVFVSQIFRYMSLAVAPVSLVVPIQRLSPVFRVIFSWVLNRDHEWFGVWVMSGIALSMLGAMLLTISTDLVVSMMPASLEGLLRFDWP